MVYSDRQMAIMKQIIDIGDFEYRTWIQIGAQIDKIDRQIDA